MRRLSVLSTYRQAVSRCFFTDPKTVETILDTLPHFVAHLSHCFVGHYDHLPLEQLSILYEWRAVRFVAQDIGR